MHAFIQFVLVLGSVAAFCAYWLIWAARDQISLKGALVKAASTGLLATSFVTEPASQNLGSGLWLLPLGLYLGALGDFALARRGQGAFLLGMAAFAVGHLCYAAGFWWHTQSIMATGPQIALITPLQYLISALLLVLVFSTEYWLIPRTDALRWPVRGYVWVIAVMAASVIFLANIEGSILPRLGAALFVLSDLLLALRLFVLRDAADQAKVSLALWPIYWLGQVLIQCGAMIYWIYPKG